MDTKAFDTFDNRAFLRFSNPALIEKDLQILIGILEGMRSGKVVNIIEHSELRN